MPLNSISSLDQPHQRSQVDGGWGRGGRERGMEVQEEGEEEEDIRKRERK